MHHSKSPKAMLLIFKYFDYRLDVEGTWHRVSPGLLISVLEAQSDAHKRSIYTTLKVLVQKTHSILKFKTKSLSKIVLTLIYQRQSH